MPAKESEVLKRSLWQEKKMDPAREDNNRPKRYSSYRRKLIAVAAAVIVIAAGFTVYYSILNARQPGKSITVYTYDSFFAYGLNKTNARNAVFHTFESEYGVTVNVKYIKGSLINTLYSERNHPRADIVIGLTNMNGIQAVKEGLLAKYTPPADGYINSSLLKGLGTASSYLAPYEYSYLGIDYNKTYFGTDNLTPAFSDLSNRSMASNLLLQYPTSSNTGQGFLLWEISYYKYVLGENWTGWWKDVKNYTAGHIYNDWATSFNYFDTGPNTRLLVSYLTDPAYNSFFGYGNSTGSTLSFHASKAYGWRTIYGIGIVNGSQNMTLDREFINYFLGPSVQNEIPQNEWMYPANQTIGLPGSFNAIQNFGQVYPLNNYLNATEIYNNVKSWDTEWLNIMQ